MFLVLGIVMTKTGAHMCIIMFYFARFEWLAFRFFWFGWFDGIVAAL